jgi:hypothetical protein
MIIELTAELRMTAMFQCCNCLNWIKKYNNEPIDCDNCGQKYERLSKFKIEPVGLPLLKNEVYNVFAKQEFLR